LNWALQDPQRFGSFGLGRLAKDFGNDWKGEYVSPVLGKAALLASVRPDVDFLRKQLEIGRRTLFEIFFRAIGDALADQVSCALVAT
jgi:hypothetical protein